MMKKIIIVMTVVALIVGTGHHVRAETRLPLSLDELETVRNNCVGAQSILYRIHANDGVLRVNLKRRYDSIATKLMAPLNSRMTLNRLDATKLVATTADYERELDNFRQLYQSYEETISQAIFFHCKSQPADFYDIVTGARDKRMAVDRSVKQLNSIIRQYAGAVKELEDSLDKRLQERS